MKAPETARIRVASYNICKSVGLDARRDPGRILDVIAELAPDVIALQEVDRRFGERRSTLAPDAIVRRTGLSVVPLATHGHGLGWHGNALLVRAPLRVLARRRLALPHFEPRGAVSAVIETGGIRLRLVSMHLSLFARYRRRQVAQVLGEIDAEPEPLPVLLMGDLNEWYGASRSLRLLGQRFRLVATGRSFPAPAPIGQLDRIFASPEIAVRDAGIHASPTARIASDHLPVWADIALPARR